LVPGGLRRRAIHDGACAQRSWECWSGGEMVPFGRTEAWALERFPVELNHGRGLPPALRATSPTMGEENKCQRYFFPPPSWGRSRA
jgi:hypothetical protein